MFTIELRTKEDVKMVSLDRDEKVLIEGSIGKLIRARFLEGLVLEVIGTSGELRVDLAENDIVIHPSKDEGPNGSKGCGP